MRDKYPALRVLFFAGECDGVVSAAEIATQRARCVAAGLNVADGVVVTPGTGQLPFLENADEFTAALVQRVFT